MSRTYSLAEVAEDLCGECTPQATRWIADQIRAKRFSALKVRGHWRMSAEDVVAAFASCKNDAQHPGAAEKRVLSLSPTSARRRRAS